jgi:activator of 2-hydroxyglutaryl-CoA dehydratase
MTTKGYVCGIDVGSEKLDVALCRNTKLVRTWTETLRIGCRGLTANIVALPSISF